MRKILLYILLPALLLSGCVSEEEFISPDNGGGKPLEATLTLRVTGGSTAATRALTAEDENEIEEIDVLVFKKASGDAGNGTFDYRAQTTLIKTDLDDVTKATKNFKVTLRRSTDSNDLQKLVVLANCRSAVEALGDMTGKTYEQVAQLLTMIPPTNSVWQANNSQFVPFPMWGEQSGFSVFSGTNAVPDVIDLFRAVAAVDVVVGAGAQSDFELTSVHFRVNERRGQLIPASANWNKTEKKAIAPTMPSVHLGGDYESFTLTSPDKVEGNIYVFEQPAAAQTAGSAPELGQESCLIVTGRYKGGAIGHYRVDFFGRDDEEDITDSFLPLLRNFRYTVTIDRVDGSGYPNPGEAALYRFSNLTATTHRWNQGDMGSVVWDGHLYLAVTKNSYEIDNGVQTIDYIKVAAGGELPDDAGIYRNWRASITLDTDDQANWLQFSPGSSSGYIDGVAYPLTMQVLANTHRDRTAIVTVTAGRLKQEIRIMQRMNKQLSLDVGDVEAIFPAATAPAAFSLPVEWEPAATPVQIEVINPGTPAAAAYAQEFGGATQGLVFSGANVIPSTLADGDSNPANGGMALLSIKPEAATLAAFVERRSILKITSSNGVATQVKTVLLRQFDYRIAVEGQQSTYQQNTTYSLTVKANGEWVVSSVGEVSNLSMAGNEPNISGVPLSFKTGATNNSTSTLTFSLRDYPAVKQVVSVPMKRLEPNCYILKPVAGQNTATIPVAKVFRLWSEDQDLKGAARGGNASGDNTAMTSAGGYTVELLWADEPELQTGITLGSLTAQNNTGTFTVTVAPGTKQGNAIVSLKENGTIRWSWHIWVCNFDPEQNTGYNPYDKLRIMDRNLGATNTTYGDIGTYGMYYQSGRPTPFPKVSGTLTPSFKTIYGGSITRVDMAIYAGNLAHRNLANALSNPTVFYHNARTIAPGGTTNQRAVDWYSPTIEAADGASFYRRNLWGQVKTDYDPCPEGWRVPEASFARYIPKSFTWENGKGEIQYNMDGGYYGLFASEGQIEGIGGNLSAVGTESWIYQRQNEVSRTNSGAFASAFNNTAAGVTVRCVKIE